MKNKKTDASAVGSSAEAPSTQPDTQPNTQPDKQPGDAAPADAGRRPATRTTTTEAAPRTGDHREQVKVWEEEGGSPPEQISSTSATRPKTASKAGSMGSAKD